MLVIYLLPNVFMISYGTWCYSLSFLCMCIAARVSHTVYSKRYVSHTVYSKRYVSQAVYSKRNVSHIVYSKRYVSQTVYSTRYVSHTYSLQ